MPLVVEEVQAEVAAPAPPAAPTAQATPAPVTPQNIAQLMVRLHDRAARLHAD
jgi:hypothetical protein